MVGGSEFHRVRPQRATLHLLILLWAHLWTSPVNTALSSPVKLHLWNFTCQYCYELTCETSPVNTALSSPVKLHLSILLWAHLWNFTYQYCSVNTALSSPVKLHLWNFTCQYCYELTCGVTGSEPQESLMLMSADSESRRNSSYKHMVQVHTDDCRQHS